MISKPQLFAAAAFAVLLVGCNSHIQTTSGRDYLDRAAAAGAVLDDEMKAAASIEPLLTFPARIGIARIENGTLTDIPQPELDAWTEALAARADDGSEYLPVSLFVTDLVAAQSASSRISSVDHSARRREIVRQLQLGGARQHLDAILVYEVTGHADNRGNSFSILDLTIVGAYIAPSRKLNTEGRASALLFDVRNGYPYGAADASDTRQKSSPIVHAKARARELLADSQLAAVAQLAPEVSKMIAELERTLSTRGSDDQPGRASSAR